MRSFVRFVLLAAVLGCRSPAAGPGSASSSLDASVVRGEKLDAGVDARPVETARPSSRLAKLVVHGAEAFWFDHEGTLLVQRTVDGSQPEPLTHAHHEATALGVDATTVWFIDLDGGGVSNAAELVTVARSDGARRVVARLPHAETFVVARDSAWVVVTPDPSKGAAEVQQISRSGVITRIAAVAPNAGALVADETSLYTAHDEVTRIAQSGGATKVLGPSPETAIDMALVADEIVLVGVDPQSSTRTLWAYPRKGPPKTPENVTLLHGGASRLSEEGEDVTAFASDGRRIFYCAIPVAEGDAPTAKLRLAKRGKTSGPELARVPSSAGIAIARGRIYWPTATGLQSVPLPP